ncbi:MAG: putative cadmium-transporting ATPase, partial [Planctomycetota bacterium]
MSTLTSTSAENTLRNGPDDASGAERLERQLFVALLGGVLLLAAWVSGYFGIERSVSDIPALLGALILVVPLAKGAFEELREGRASSDSLASLAVFAAIANELYLAAGFLAFFLWFSELVLSRTAWGAQRAIRDLLELTPDIARVVGADGSEREVSLGEVRAGTMVRVRPGENLPADGVVRSGTSSINQASLTGEAVPIEVQAGASVYAGTTNLTGQIDVEVTAVKGETTIGKVEKLIREAESARTQRQELIERLAGAYVPVVLIDRK